MSRLGGRARIKKHVGPSNLRLTCHLGVKVPEGCGIEVAGVEMGWKEGECIVFDDAAVHLVGSGEATTSLRARELGVQAG